MDTVELISTLGALPPRGGPVQDPVLADVPRALWRGTFSSSSSSLFSSLELSDTQVDATEIRARLRTTCLSKSELAKNSCKIETPVQQGNLNTFRRGQIHYIAASVNLSFAASAQNPKPQTCIGGDIRERGSQPASRDTSL